MNALQVVEQRKTYMQEGTNEEAFVAGFKEKFSLRISTEVVMKEEEKKRGTDKPITGNTTKAISSPKERKRRNTSMLGNIARKPIILKPDVGSRICSVKIANNLVIYKNFAKPEKIESNRLTKRTFQILKMIFYL